MVSDAVIAFCVGAALMVAAGVVAVFFAVPAEQRSLEDIATPLSAVAGEGGTGGGRGEAAKGTGKDVGDGPADEGRPPL